MNNSISPDTLAALCQLDTCTVSNVIETFGVRLRNEGFTNSSIRSLFPKKSTMGGYAVTVRMRCSSPPPDAHPYHDRTDWWNYILSIPAPRVIVIEDVDPQPGLGSFIGEIHTHILKALDCVGVVTNGAVRDVQAVQQADFSFFAGNVAVSHAYAHIVDFGHPVKVGGLPVNPGDLLMGDVHGVLSVPLNVAPEIPAKAASLVAREQEVIRFCQSKEFSVGALREMLRDVV